MISQLFDLYDILCFGIRNESSYSCNIFKSESTFFPKNVSHISGLMIISLKILVELNSFIKYKALLFITNYCTIFNLIRE